MTKVLKVGIIGLAHLHPRTYMPHFLATPSTQVVAASDPMESLRQGFENDFGVRTYAHWKKLLGSEDLDLAYVFLPHDECPAAAIACAERKIHVVVEKPAANTAARARKVVEACRENRVLFSTPYLWRYHPVCREMKRTVDSGVLGRIVGCEGRCAAGGVHRYVEAHAGWMLKRKKSGGGPMVNLGVHWIDLFRWLLGNEVSQVVAKNVHVRYSPDGLTLAPFDWGGAGWGLPATDLGQLRLPYQGRPPKNPNLAAYHAVVRERWPDLGVETIRRLVDLGQLFWSLKVISRCLPEFEYDPAYLEYVMYNFRIYETILADAHALVYWLA